MPAGATLTLGDAGLRRLDAEVLVVPSLSRSAASRQSTTGRTLPQQTRATAGTKQAAGRVLLVSVGALTGLAMSRQDTLNFGKGRRSPRAECLPG